MNNETRNFQQEIIITNMDVVSPLITKVKVNPPKTPKK